MARWFIDRSPREAMPSIRLRRLLADASFPAPAREWAITGCTADADRVEPGQLFVAVGDGHQDIPLALARGAAGVVLERAHEDAGPNQIVVPDSRSALARIAHALAGNPSDRIPLVGITGRCGKSLTGLFLRSIFEAGGNRVGRIGTTSWSDGASVHPLGPESPEPEGIALMLAAMADQGCHRGIVELGAGALDRRVAEGLALQAAVVTHISGNDDPAFDREAILSLRRAGARLFRRVVPGGTTVLDADDPLADPLGGVNLRTRRVTFGLDGSASLSARILEIDNHTAQIRLLGFDREVVVRLKLSGLEEIRAALAASAVAWALGIDRDEVVAGLESVENAPGRLERVGGESDVDVRIDMARTPTELRQAIHALRDTRPGRLITVFGSEGSRGRGERILMAQVAESGSDQVILTADNPRCEPLAQIFEDLLAGFRRPGQVKVEPDRGRAIATALELAQPGDAVLIAGKGRHSYQILADRVLPFDDASVVADCLANRGGLLRRTSA